MSLPPNPVGRGRPPTHSQFKSGQSGNPKGRPKASSTLAADIHAEMNTTVPMPVKGKQVPITKQRYLVKVAMDKASKGDIRMLMQLMAAGGFSDSHTAETSADNSKTRPLPPEDKAIIDAHDRRSALGRQS